MKEEVQKRLEALKGTLENKSTGKIVIEAKKQVIPVEIGPYEFELDATDKGLEKIQEDFVNSMNLIAENANDNEKMKVILEEAFDTLLEPGAYKKIYSLVQSKSQMVNILDQLVESMLNELVARNANVLNRSSAYDKKK